MVAKAYSEFLQEKSHMDGGFAMGSERYSWLRVDILLGIKKRYIFTKQDNVRLRYVAPACAIAFFAVMNLLPLLSYAPSLNISAVEPGDSDAPEALTLNERLLDGAEFVSNNIEQAMMALKKAPPQPPKPDKPLYYSLTVKSGGTVAGTLQSVGVDSQDAYYAVQAMGKYFEPRLVKPGQVVDVHFKKDEAGVRVFDRMSLVIDSIKSVEVLKTGDDFAAEKVEKEVSVQVYARTSTIETSLYGSAARDGIPAPVIAELIRAYSWDLDFQRDIRSGDKIEVLYEVKEAKDGSVAGYGNIKYASLSVGGYEKPIYRHEMSDGRVDYFDPDGRSVRKTLMRTPIDGARLSSGFGMRKHPVLGYNKMHKGTDFAAPTGTPIYAAGDGVIEYAGRKGAYGNYIKVRHNSTLKTAYAHMNKFASNMGVGKRVEQGQVIGYVGTTGRSTGPHLHFEVLVNNAQVNPNRVDLPVGETLKGAELAAFKASVSTASKQYASRVDDVKVANRNGESSFNN